MEFDGRTVVVTGGTGALGQAVVGGLLDRGARVVIPYFPTAPESVSWSGRDGVTVSGPVDLAEEAAVERFYGGLPGLWASIHCAGGFAAGAIGETGAEDLDRQLRMNLVSCFLCCREAVKCIRRAGTAGRLVNVTARPALEPRTGSGMAAYTVSKAGVAALTQALAEELAAEGIWVNAVVPSIMDTPANRAAMPDARHDRWPKVEQVAETILFLASPANLSTRGGLVPVYGRS